jgi:hypothetical protein
MSRPLLLAAAAALLAGVASRGAAADDAKATVRVRGRWKAGDVVTRTSKTVAHTNVDVMNGETKVYELRAPKTLVTERVERCLEADADGRRTKALVHVKEWTLSLSETKDDSLTGVTIEVVSTATGSTWKQVGDKGLSKDASAWLDDNYGATDFADRRYEALEPGRAVAVGESWKADPAKIAASFSPKQSIDVEKAQATVKLAALKDGVASLETDLVLPTKHFKNPRLKTEDPWIEGGVITIHVASTHPAGGAAAGLSWHQTVAMKGVAQSQFGEMHIEFGQEDEVATRAGGTIPEPAAPSAPAPAPTK